MGQIQRTGRPDDSEILPPEQPPARAITRAITKDMITQAVRVARKHAGVVDFRFHDYRHSAKTAWSRRGVHVDVAMKAAGHKSVAMHQRCVNLKPGDVAKAFGIIEDCSHSVPKDLPAKQANSATN